MHKLKNTILLLVALIFFVPSVVVAEDYGTWVPGSTKSKLGLPVGTVAQMLAITSPTVGYVYEVTDGATATACDTGTGSYKVTCKYNGAAWVPIAVSATTEADITDLQHNKSIYKTTATAYTIGTTSASECYGGYITVTGAAVITACDALATGMNFTVDVQGAIAVSLDVQADDRMRLDGTALDDGDKATGTSTSGDTITCFYESAVGWACWSNSVAGTKWSDGGP